MNKKLPSLGSDKLQQTQEKSLAKKKLNIFSKVKRVKKVKDPEVKNPPTSHFTKQEQKNVDAKVCLPKFEPGMK